MFIGNLSAKTGFSKDTIRYYEKIGLIQSSGYVRQANNYKSYTVHTLNRLNHIQELKSAGFTLAEIVDLLDSFQQGSHPCAVLPESLADKLSRINEKIESLENYRHSIQKIMEACDSKCALRDGLPNCIRC